MIVLSLTLGFYRHVYIYWRSFVFQLLFLVLEHRKIVLAPSQTRFKILFRFPDLTMIPLWRNVLLLDEHVEKPLLLSNDGCFCALEIGTVKSLAASVVSTSVLFCTAMN
jgi:hypothetical protein